MNKICVYAICKNESQFIEKWLNSMSEADYIVVLDTGSEDDTYEKLKNDSRVTKVEQKIINPWRFDVARNESMKLIPEDANILLCTDLDEVLEPGWAEIIRINWIDNFHIRGYYKYAWSHAENGEPGRIFYYDKLHNRNWKWIAPVHELLEPTKEEYKQLEYEKEHILNLFDKGVYLHHYPDMNKSRSSYLPLLKLRAEENPNDYYGLYYLAHEYYYRGFYQESIDTLNLILNKREFSEKLTNLEKSACYLFIGDSYTELKDNQWAAAAYNKAIEIYPSYREPYIAAAKLFNNKKLYDIAIGYIEQMFKNTYRQYNWLERDNSWREAPYDELSVAYYYNGNYRQAWLNCKIALEYKPNDERILKNLEFIESKLNN